MQLSHDTGLPKSSISEVLAGKKSFSRQMIRKLADYFHVDVGVLAAFLSLARAKKEFCCMLKRRIRTGRMLNRGII